MHSFRRYNQSLARQYEQWMLAMHYAKITQSTYRKIIRRYVEFVGDKSIADATHLDIRAYIADISESGASLGTVYQNLNVLRLFYDFLHLGGVVNYVAPRFVKLRSPTKQNLLRPLSEAQVQTLLNATQKPRELALVEFFYATGCRLSEVVHLKIENLDFAARTARIRGKFGKVRSAILTNDAVNALRKYIGNRESGYVFREDLPIQKGCVYMTDGKWMSRWTDYFGPKGKPINRNKFLGSVRLMPYETARKLHDEHFASLKLVRPTRNRPLSKMAIQQLIKRIACRAGLKGVTPHTFRRTFATHLYDHGAGAEVIKALMGHVWIQTTLNYMKIGPDRLAKAFDQYHPRGRLNGEAAHSGPHLRRTREEA